MNEPTLQSLRVHGWHLFDPAGFHHLEVLHRRLQTQPAPVQRVLADRLNVAVSAYAQRAKAKAGLDRPVAAACTPASGVSVLAQLNLELAALHRAESVDVPWADSASNSDMKSVRRFSEAWSRISAEQQVVKALQRGPENAGPLNSHKLVLRSLRMMRTLSPDYLRRFMVQMDALMWLDQVTAKPERAAQRQARTGRGSRGRVL